jgi:hypothetical protein
LDAEVTGRPCAAVRKVDGRNPADGIVIEGDDLLAPTRSRLC